MATAVVLAAMPACSSAFLAISRGREKWVLFKPLASSYSAQPLSSSSSLESRKLILYSKPGCCLCDGLKEKLHAAFSLSATDALHDVDLQIRDITTNPEWERAYQYEIPVLARVLPDGTEMYESPHETHYLHEWRKNRFSCNWQLISLQPLSYSGLDLKLDPKPIMGRSAQEVLPRFSPRLGVELIQKKLAAALKQ